MLPPPPPPPRNVEIAPSETLHSTFLRPEKQYSIYGLLLWSFLEIIYGATYLTVVTQQTFFYTVSQSGYLPPCSQNTKRHVFDNSLLLCLSVRLCNET